MLIKILYIIGCLAVFAQARENPFFPVDAQQDTATAKEKPKPFSYEIIDLPSEARVLQEIEIKYKTLDASLKTKTIKLNRSIDWHKPLVVSQQKPTCKTTKITKISKTTANKPYKKLFEFQYATFYAKGNKIEVETQDELLRDFMLINPHRIVLDFKRDANFLSYKKINKNTIFRKIRIGNHDKYYRVVIELDGKYIYSKKTTTKGYMFVLR